MASRNRLYPHLLDDDIDLWVEYLNSIAPKYSTIDYDVRVGGGRDPGPKHSPNIRQMAIDLSQRRIDAVGHLTDAIHIIEITRHAGLKALGQLTVYPALYTETFHPTKQLVTVLLCREVGTDVLPSFIRQQTIIHIIK